MKNILGHSAWNAEEIIQMLKQHGSFTMCSLPHYRFDRVKAICRNLEQRQLIRRTGKTETSVNFAVTELFRKWRLAFDYGVTSLGPVKWAKKQRNSAAPVVE